MRNLQVLVLLKFHIYMEFSSSSNHQECVTCVCPVLAQEASNPTEIATGPLKSGQSAYT